VVCGEKRDIFRQLLSHAFVARLVEQLQPINRKIRLLA
jgi:hypothetical protein